MDKREISEIRPLSRGRRIGYSVFGALVVASGAWVAFGMDSSQDPAVYVMVGVIVALAGLTALGFGLFGKVETYTDDSWKYDAAALSPAQADNVAPEKELWELPWYQRYAIAAAATGGAFWLGLSDALNHYPDWVRYVAVVGLVGTALVGAWELGCWAIGIAVLLAGIALVVNIVPSLSTPVAIIIGAIIIGAMVSSAIGRNRS